MKQSLILLLSSLVLALFPCLVSALHLDIVVAEQSGKLTTSFCLDGGPSCDRLSVLDQLGLNENELIDSATGKNLFISDFGDLAGGPHAVDDPGFISANGVFPANHILKYQGLGSLQYWASATDGWINNVPEDVRIHLFGGLDVTSVIITDPNQCNGQLFCFKDVFSEGSTVFSSSGISGADSLIIDNTDSNGTLHTHLDFTLEQPNGDLGGAVGAYMLEMMVTSEGFENSDPFLIMFNHGLSDGEFADALSSRLAVSTIPIPPAIVFFSSGMIMLTLFGQRRRTLIED